MENINLANLSRDFGGIGDPLLFLHANGYPPECYLPLLNQLSSRYQIIGMLMRPLWEGSSPTELENWKPLSNDLCQFLKAAGKGRVVAVGHSLGAIVSIRAALHSPDKFSALILLDPVLFIPPIIHTWRLIRELGLGHKLHPLIPAAQNRRRTFDNLDNIYNVYRQKNVFRYITNENLRTMIAGMTKPTEDGYELVYSPDWEVRIYYNGVSGDMDIWQGLSNIEVPIFIIRGDETDTFLPSAATRFKRLRPFTRIDTVKESTHLVPLEKPKEVSELIIDFLENQK